MRLLQDDGRTVGSTEPQLHLAMLLLRARSWWDEMISSQMTVTDLARKHAVTSSHASRIIRLNFLAPAIIDSIVSGTQPADLDRNALLNLNELSLEWTRQKEQLRIQ